MRPGLARIKRESPARSLFPTLKSICRVEVTSIWVTCITSTIMNETSTRMASEKHFTTWNSKLPYAGITSDLASARLALSVNLHTASRNSETCSQGTQTYSFNQMCSKVPRMGSFQRRRWRENKIAPHPVKTADLKSVVIMTVRSLALSVNQSIKKKQIRI